MTSVSLTNGALRWAAAVALLVVCWSVRPALAERHPPAFNTPIRTAEQDTRVVRINPEQFERMAEEGSVILIDVRPHSAYQQAHLPNAVAIPLEELEGALARLRATNARIVLYCSGSAGRRSGRAAAWLRERGFDRVYCLRGGFEAWVASGRVVIVEPHET